MSPPQATDMRAVIGNAAAGQKTNMATFFRKLILPIPRSDLFSLLFLLHDGPRSRGRGGENAGPGPFKRGEASGSGMRDGLLQSQRQGGPPSSARGSERKLAGAPAATKDRVADASLLSE